MNSILLRYNSHSQCYTLHNTTSTTHAHSTNDIVQVIFFFFVTKTGTRESEEAFYKNRLKDRNEPRSPTDNKAHRSTVS